MADTKEINVYETIKSISFQVDTNTNVVNINKVIIEGGGGTGATNLGYTPSATNGIVTSDTGADATIPLADATNAGLLTPAEKTKIANSVPYTGATEDVDLGLKDLYLEKLWLRDDPNDNYGSVHYTDGNFHIEDGDGHPLFVIEDGYIQLHKTATIQSNLYTSLLTAIRNHYLPDASGTLALTSDLNLNGLSDVAIITPTNNEVLVYETDTDLWKNKSIETTLGYTPANLNSPTFTGTVVLPKTTTINTYSPIVNIVKDAVPTTPITGTLTETILNSYLIPENTFSASDMMKIPYFEVNKVGALGGGVIRIYINTSNTLTGAVQIARYNLISTNLYVKMARQFNINSGILTGLSFTGTGNLNDLTAFGQIHSSTSFNETVDNYIIITAAISSTSDSIQQRGFCVTN
jgi:hypothetical protein